MTNSQFCVRACLCVCLCESSPPLHLRRSAFLLLCSSSFWQNKSRRGASSLSVSDCQGDDSTQIKQQLFCGCLDLLAWSWHPTRPRLLIGPVSTSMLVHSQTIGVSLRITESFSFFVVAPTVGLRAAVCVLELLFWCQQQLPKWKILWRDTPVSNFKAVHGRSFPVRRKLLLFMRAKGSNISDLSSCHPHLSLCAKSTTRKCLSSSWLNRRGLRLCGTRTNIWRAEPSVVENLSHQRDQWTPQIYRLHVFAP